MSNKEIMKITMNLVIICALAGVILSATWALTDPVKLQKEAQEREAALKSLIPQADSIKEVKDIVTSGKEGRSTRRRLKERLSGTSSWLIPKDTPALFPCWWP